MAWEEVIQGRRITDQDIELIRSLIDDHPDWNRTRISRELCRLWQWQNDVGRQKDMACRSLLLKLEKREKILLPPRCCPSVNHLRGLRQSDVVLDEDPIECRLKELLPLQIEVLRKAGPQSVWGTALNRYHYLGSVVSGVL